MGGNTTTGGLRRRLGVATATSLIVASMIGTGIFSTTGLMLARVESAWLVLLCWLLGGVVSLAGALSYAELATMMPQAGGEYVYLQKCYGPLTGFLTGWTSFFVSFSAPIAATAVACAKYLSAGGRLPGTALAQNLMAMGVVLFFTALHAVSVRIGAWVQNVLTATKLLLLGGLVLAGFSTGRGSWKFLQSSSDFWAPARWSQMGISLLWVTFAYSGWNASSYIAEEVERPARTLPRSLVLGTVTVTVIYLLINLFLTTGGADRRHRRGCNGCGTTVWRWGCFEAVHHHGPGAALLPQRLCGDRPADLLRHGPGGFVLPLRGAHPSAI